MTLPPKRLALFIDAQNVYKGARDAFFTRLSPNLDGQVDPTKIGALIVARECARGNPTVLSTVRVYTGYKTPEQSNRGYAAFRKQRAHWEATGCHVTARPLRYNHNDANDPGREKGVDVALAVDFVDLAVTKAYDVGVVFSADTDLMPALEFVRERCAPIAIPQSATWRSEIWSQELRMRYMWCHRLTRADYDAVHDPTDYAPETMENRLARLKARFNPS